MFAAELVCIMAVLFGLACIEPRVGLSLHVMPSKKLPAKDPLLWSNKLGCCTISLVTLVLEGPRVSLDGNNGEPPWPYVPRLPLHELVSGVLNCPVVADKWICADCCAGRGVVIELKSRRPIAKLAQHLRTLSKFPLVPFGFCKLHGVDKDTLCNVKLPIVMPRHAMEALHISNMVAPGNSTRPCIALVIQIVCIRQTFALEQQIKALFHGKG